VLRGAAALAATVALAVPPATAGARDSHVFDGGTLAERQVVVSALEASAFDWGFVPGPITIHIVRGEPSRSIPHEIWLDADLLDAGRFAWGVVQHEYAHQVDYLLLDDAERATLLTRLRGRDWCHGVPGLAHSDYGCERFASTLAWSYWPSPDNSMRPAGPHDESAAMAPGRFRALMTRLIGAPSRSSAASTRRH